MVVKRGLFLFRRDFRLYDNMGLNALSQTVDEILPVFILNPAQLKPSNNPYFSHHCVQFMVESLSELDQMLQSQHQSQLVLLYGKIIKVLSKLHRMYPFETLALNRDYTPFSIERDRLIEEWCLKKGITFLSQEDGTLLPIGSVRTGADTIYKVFTPFFHAASIRPTPKPTRITPTVSFARFSSSWSVSKMKSLYKSNPDAAVQGGRSHALKILDHLTSFKKYNEQRDTPAIPSTQLSAYLKFGCISIREFKEAVVKHLGTSNDLFKQCYWREFYYNIAFAFPHVFGHPFKEKYATLKWKNNSDWFQCWKEGMTGFPFIDAGMRELHTTGFMHNRLRMAVSMFLTKDLLIDWRWGEQYFATQLIDYDPCQNNGGWQWSASTGTDSQPYFRIFNPNTMAKRLDPEATYIKQWIPELNNVPAADLFQWETAHVHYPSVSYPRPMVSHAEQRVKALEMYKSA